MENAPAFAISPDKLADPALCQDPYPTYHLLREQSPVRFVLIPTGTLPDLHEPVYAWAFLKWGDAYGALRDNETYTTDHQLIGKVLLRAMLLNDDPPRHLHLRRLVNQSFSPKRIAAIEPWITAIAHELLDAMISGQVEFMAAYAIPLPMRVIARFLGIPGEQYPTFKRWSDAMVSPLTMAQETRKPLIEQMQKYFKAMAEERRRARGDDLITVLVEGEPGGGALEDGEIISFCMTLLIAGNETTTNLIGNLIGVLAKRPDLWQMLRADRSLVDACIDESLRHESPLQRMYRRSTCDIEVSGVQIPKDSLIAIYYGAANRDPKVFPDPDTFRLDRKLTSHVAFGAGIHYCIGAPLARIETRITLNALLDRFPILRPGDEPAVRKTVSLSGMGYQKLPLILR
jgi:cytochrome P450